MYTVEQLNDIEAIRRLRIDYSYFYDTNDINSLIKLFSSDCICSWDEEHGGKWSGIEEIKNNFIASMKCFPGYFRVMHAITNHRIDLDSSTLAHGESFLLDLNFCFPERPSVIGTVGIYKDTYVKEADTWKFKSINLEFLWPKRSI